MLQGAAGVWSEQGWRGKEWSSDTNILLVLLRSLIVELLGVSDLNIVQRNENSSSTCQYVTLLS